MIQIAAGAMSQKESYFSSAASISKNQSRGCAKMDLIGSEQWLGSWKEMRSQTQAFQKLRPKIMCLTRPSTGSCSGMEKRLVSIQGWGMKGLGRTQGSWWRKSGTLSSTVSSQPRTSTVSWVSGINLLSTFWWEEEAPRRPQCSLPAPKRVFKKRWGETF